jgi:GntR family transcriptional repressor for pyruvate dehydrogenase complex
MPMRDDPARLSDRVAAELERQILRGELRAGGQLPTEAELGEIFGVSRSAVRDAVRTVAARGLLDVQAGRGTTILPVSDDAFSHALLALLVRSDLKMGEVMDARAAIETGLIPLAATRASAEQRAEVAHELERFGRAIAQADWAETEKAHLSLHLALLRAIDMPALDLMLRPLQQVILACSPPAKRNSSETWELDGHAAIVDALAACDEEKLRCAMREHFAYVDDPAYAGRRARRFDRASSVEALLAAGLSRHRPGR